MKTSSRARGFNLVEILVAGVILSGVVVTAGAISSRSMQGVRLNRQYELAVSLMERQLNLIDYTGVDTFMESGQTEGDFGDMAPGYRWSVSAEYLDVDQLYAVTLTVTWMDGPRIRTVSMDTRLNGTGTALPANGETSESPASR